MDFAFDSLAYVCDYLFTEFVPSFLAAIPGLFTFYSLMRLVVCVWFLILSRIIMSRMIPGSDMVRERKQMHKELEWR